MNKKTFIAIIAAVASLACAAEPISPSSIHTGTLWDVLEFKDGYSLIRPWNGCYMEFTDNIAVNNNAEAAVTCGNEVVATASAISVDEENNLLYVDFDEINLPKGEEYVFSLKAGAVSLTSDPTATNEDITVTFSVPANIDYVSGVTPKYVSDTDKRFVGLTLSIGTEVVAVGEPQWILKRNGEVIGEYAATVKVQDYNHSTCEVDFPAITFDAGAEYILTLPEGSYAAKYRTDITNLERVEYLQRGESGINEITTENNAPAGTFDLQGRRVLIPGKGIYIVNGRKVRL